MQQATDFSCDALRNASTEDEPCRAQKVQAVVARGEEGDDDMLDACGWSDVWVFVAT